MAGGDIADGRAVHDHVVPGQTGVAQLGGESHRGHDPGDVGQPLHGPPLGGGQVRDHARGGMQLAGVDDGPGPDPPPLSGGGMDAEGLGRRSFPAEADDGRRQPLLPGRQPAGQAVGEELVALGPGERVRGVVVPQAVVVEAAGEVVDARPGRDVGGEAAVVVLAGLVDEPGQAVSAPAAALHVLRHGQAVQLAHPGVGGAVGQGHGEGPPPIPPAVQGPAQHVVLEGQQLFHLAVPGAGEGIEPLDPVPVHPQPLGGPAQQVVGVDPGAPGRVVPGDHAEIGQHLVDAVGLGRRHVDVVGSPGERQVPGLPGHGLAAQAVGELHQEQALHPGLPELPAGRQPRHAAADDEDIDGDRGRGGERRGIDGAAQQMPALRRHGIDEARLHIAVRGRWPALGAGPGQAHGAGQEPLEEAPARHLRHGRVLCTTGDCWRRSAAGRRRAAAVS